MGSWASGNYRRERRQTTDELPCIHVRDLTDLPLSPSEWSYVMYFGMPALRLSRYADTIRFGVTTEEDVISIADIRLVHSSRNLGGHQTYLQCNCGKRVTALYIGDAHIACRHCHKLLYDSQFTPKHEQPAAKAAKLRAKIGGGPALLQPLPDKPKYMHRETYERITYQILHYELAAAQELKRYRDERWLPVLLKLDELEAKCQG